MGKKLIILLILIFLFIFFFNKKIISQIIIINSSDLIFISQVITFFVIIYLIFFEKISLLLWLDKSLIISLSETIPTIHHLNCLHISLILFLIHFELLKKYLHFPRVYRQHQTQLPLSAVSLFG